MEESGRWVTKWPTIHGVINVRGVFLWQIISKVHFSSQYYPMSCQLAVTHIASQQLLTSTTTLMFTLGFCILRAGELEGVGEPRGVMHSWREELRIARVIKLSLQKM